MKNIKWVHLFLLLGFLICIFQCSEYEGERKEYLGTFYANDCGVSHGGHEWAGSYTASLIVEGSNGDLKIVLEVGLGDYLDRHDFKITDFSKSSETISFKIDGRMIRLSYVEEDTIWNGEYNNHYIANNSDDQSEQIGTIPIEVFYGLPFHYYIELRIKQDSSSPNKQNNMLLSLY